MCIGQFEMSNTTKPEVGTYYSSVFLYFFFHLKSFVDRWFSYKVTDEKIGCQNENINKLFLKIHRRRWIFSVFSVLNVLND